LKYEPEEFNKVFKNGIKEIFEKNGEIFYEALFFSPFSDKRNKQPINEKISSEIKQYLLMKKEISKENIFKQKIKIGTININEIDDSCIEAENNENVDIFIEVTINDSLTKNNHINNLHYLNYDQKESHSILNPTHFNIQIEGITIHKKDVDGFFTYNNEWIISEGLNEYVEQNHLDKKQQRSLEKMIKNQNIFSIYEDIEIISLKDLTKMLNENKIKLEKDIYINYISRLVDINNKNGGKFISKEQEEFLNKHKNVYEKFKSDFFETYNKIDKYIEELYTKKNGKENKSYYISQKEQYLKDELQRLKEDKTMNNLKPFFKKYNELLFPSNGLFDPTRESNIITAFIQNHNNLIENNNELQSELINLKIRPGFTFFKNISNEEIEEVKEIVEIMFKNNKSINKDINRINNFKK
jgi:hypothetical protein